MEATWGNFQSLIQLAAAANLIVFTLVQLRDYYSSNELQLLKLTKDEVDELEDSTAKTHLKDRYFAIKREFERSLAEDQKAFAMLNPASVVVFFFSLGLLVFSSVASNGPIGPGGVFLALAVHLPPVVAAVFMLIKIAAYSRLRAARQKLENKL